MKSPISFSQSYLLIIKSLLKVYNDLDKRKALFFKKRDNIYITAMSRNTIVHARTGTDNANFKEDELGIQNLNSFLNYTSAIDYGDDSNAEIFTVEEKSTKNNTISSFLFEGKYGSFRMPVADLRGFKERKHRIIPMESNKDPLKKVAKFYLNSSDVKLLVKDVQLMNKIDNFFISIVDNEIKFYMKGIERQQFSRSFKGDNVKVYDDFTTVNNNNENALRIFKTKIIDYMSYFGCDFEVELRLVPNGNILAFKARGIIPKNDNNPDDIYVLVGTQENTAEVCGNNLDIVE